MQPNRFSIFSKLFLVLVGAGGLILVVIGVGQYYFFKDFGPGPGGPRFFHNEMGEGLVARLGSPPNFENGKAVAEKLNLAIRVEGKNWSWASSPEAPFSRPGGSVPGEDGPRPGGPPAWMRIVPHFLHPLFFRGGPKGPPPMEFAHEFSDGPAKVIVSGGMRMPKEPSLTVMWCQIAAILLIIVGSYFIIRWVLKPLAALDAGVRAFASGKLAHRVPVQSHDELGALANAFNEMGQKVREMIDSKQQLLVDVSHELRSPLTRAKVGLGLLPDSDATKQIGADLDELEAMIGNLLESARLSSTNDFAALELSAVDVNALARDLAEQYRAHGKPVEFTSGAESVIAEVDREKIQSVLRNLIENALKYSPGEKNVTLAVATQSDRVRFEVRDEGMGIAAEELGKVFDPFYRVDKSRTRKTGGFGLGLSLCKRIANAHRGEIFLESKIEHGTTAILILPLHHKSTT